MNTMTYKGLAARVEFDAEDEIFVGRIAGINDVVGFHADNAKDLKEAFHDAVDGYLEACKEAGKEPERAFSGKLMLRVKPELHQQLALAAELLGKSLNQLSEELLVRSLAFPATPQNEHLPFEPMINPTYLTNLCVKSQIAGWVESPVDTSPGSILWRYGVL